MVNATQDDPAPVNPRALAAVAKFYDLVDPHVSGDTIRRIFFEYLRTKPNITDDELQTCQVIGDLISELDQARLTA